MLAAFVVTDPPDCKFYIIFPSILSPRVVRFIYSIPWTMKDRVPGTVRRIPVPKVFSIPLLETIPNEPRATPDVAPV